MVNRLTVPTLALVSAALVSACGGSAGSGAAANLADPVATSEGYMKAIEGGKADGGQEFLENNINDGIPLTGATSVSKFMAANKGAKWQVATVNYPPPGTTNPVPTKKACTVIPPQGGQTCIVTVQIDVNGKPAYFHLTTETRYEPGKWHILDVDQVDQKPDNLLPSGNEAHIS
ncbi:MAG: hypothetical protein WAT58_05775 [Candidatus Dormiibacterota bacterium]